MANRETPIAKRNIALYVLLSLVVPFFGVYWVYLLVKNTHLIQNNNRSCVKEMLCLIFVPFYQLYWLYTRGEELKWEFKRRNHQATSSGVLHLIIGLFGLNVVSWAIMQSDFNSLSWDPLQEQQENNIANGETLLRVENLCQYFKMGKKELKAVDNVSFDIKRGEVFGLVGESGCGKTTTGRSIIKIYDITSGNVYFKGQRIAAGTRSYRDAIKAAKKEMKGANDARKSELAKIIADNKAEISKARHDNRVAKRSKAATKIQMIFQDPSASLNPRMTVKEIISEGLVINGVKNKEYIEQKVYETLELVGLVREHAGRYQHEFSGGQRQRIGIARSVIMQPDMIIADEPISALDVSIQAQVINLLNELREQLGLTILFIAHDLSVVKYFSDRIGVMHFGKLVELADSDELFAHPLHPYTKSLLSAIPQPDPHSEKKRKRITYNAAKEHDYSVDLPSLREVSPGHFVYCNDAEEAKIREELAK